MVIIEDEKGDIVGTAVLLTGPHKGHFLLAYVALQMQHLRLTVSVLHLLNHLRINIHV